VAQHIPHWSHFLQPDGGSGRCFPAGHASAGFAFFGGYFAFRDDAPGIARLWLGAALLAGLLLGIAQQMRGAHFMSHTLWSGWICWSVAWLLDGGFSAAIRHHLPLELESQP
jgi:membrane-associated PAP2 superfamily phosphatase